MGKHKTQSWHPGDFELCNADKSLLWCSFWRLMTYISVKALLGSTRKDEKEKRTLHFAPSPPPPPPPPPPPSSSKVFYLSYAISGCFVG